MPRVTQQREATKAPSTTDSANGTGPASQAKRAKDDASASITFAQRLAHSDLSIRTANLRRLSSFLHRRTPITPTDLQKIYKGLFYLFWLADKPLPQQAMAERLAAMQDGMRQVRWLDVVRGFWVMIRREWTGIDRLRLDKYMTWVRCMLAHSLRYLGKRHWDEALVQQWMDVMAELPLANNQQQRGLFLHVADIFVTELGRVLEEDGVAELTWAVVERLLQPFWDVVSTCTDASMVKRVEEEVFEALYHTAEEQEEGRSTLHELMQANADKMAEKLFALASDKSTLNKHRTRLYNLRDVWQSLQRKAEAERRKQPTADPTPAAAKRRRGEEAAAESSKKAKKRKSAEEVEDEVPMLIELDESCREKNDGVASQHNKKRKAEVATTSSSQKQKQVEQTKQSKLQLAAHNTAEHNQVTKGSVFADAAEFEVPEFGYDEVAEADEGDEDDEDDEDEDDMTAILRAEEENDGEDDSFVQEDDHAEDAQPEGEEDDEGPQMEAALGDTDSAMDDDSLFMDSDAFERAIAEEETKNRKAKAQLNTVDQPSGKGKRAREEKTKVASNAASAGKESNGAVAVNGHAQKVTKAKKQRKVEVEERVEQENADEAEAEREAEAEMAQLPLKLKTKLHKKQADTEAEVASQDKRAQNGKRKAKKAAAQDEEKEVAETPSTQSAKQRNGQQKTKKDALHQEEDPQTSTQPSSVDEEKQQSASSTASSSSSSFVTPRSRNNSRSASSPGTIATAVATTITTKRTTTTTATVTAASSTPRTSSPSTPGSAASRTPKRVSISLEHNRVQQFHHWKPLQLKADDTPPSSRSAPKSALKRASMGGESDSDSAPTASGGKKAGGGSKTKRGVLSASTAESVKAAVGPIGSPRRPTAADFF